MNPSISVPRKQVEKIIDLTYPDYKGRKICIEFTDKVDFYDTNWSGGTRNYYTALGLDENMELLARQFTPRAPWNNVVEGKTVSLPINALIVMRTFFCGKDIGITIYVNPIMEIGTQKKLSLSIDNAAKT